MNISLQMDREDFAQNFCATLAHLLAWRDGRDYKVTWNGPPTRDVATLYLHPRLGIATPLWTDPRRFAFVWRELRAGKSALESIARRLYLAAHLTPGPLRKRLAAHRVTIEPRPARFADGFCVPGGNQVRWFDPKRGTCAVALKRGFPEDYFRAQIEVRRDHEVPAPALLEVDDDAQIFIEAISSGRARIDAPSADKIRLRERALAALAPLAEATRQETSSADYAAALAGKIAEHAAASLPEAFAARIEALSLALTALAGDAPIETVIAHGDMSFGHILEEKHRLVLIDWEHAARRQRDHDRLMITLRPQLAGPFFAHLAELEIETHLALFLLEGLDLATTESANPLLHTPPPGLAPFVTALENRIAPCGTIGVHASSYDSD